MNPKELRESQRLEYEKLLEDNLNGECDSWGNEEIKFIAPKKYIDSIDQISLRVPIPLVVIRKKLDINGLWELVRGSINAKCLVCEDGIFGDKKYLKLLK